MATCDAQVAEANIDILVGSDLCKLEGEPFVRRKSVEMEPETYSQLNSFPANVIGHLRHECEHGA